MNALNGIPCSRAGKDGTVELSFATDGAVTLKCIVPPDPPAPCTDREPSSAGAAQNVGAIPPGSSVVVNGTTCAADNDWFAFTVPATGNILLRLTSTSGDSDFCLYSTPAVELQCVTGSATQLSLTDVQGTFYIRVFDAVPGSYSLLLSR